jgi:hypothetical protein
MRRRSADQPRWQHSDGNPYDEFDLGFTRFADEADLAGRRAGQSRVSRLGRLGRLIPFRHRFGSNRSSGRV